ncbi:DUF5683 domain-containing protein [Oscillatoria amoena NRMC-F 0135]|nr:DUF5683 domain-containing protein [Oscillatoria amoena NRMC-F 0135]
MKGIFFSCFVLLGFAGFTQDSDSARVVMPSKDTVVIKSYATRYKPHKALLYAAVLPGAGQIYTKKYWKLPLVYGGLFATGYAVNFYQEGYQKYKGELFDLLESDAPVSPSGFTEPQLRTIVDRYRRERDFFIIIMAGVYLLQMVDAHVDAHLKEFDLNPTLQVSVRPTVESSMFTGTTGGLSLIIRF